MLILKHLPEGQGSVGTLSMTEVWQVPFLHSPSTLRTPAGALQPSALLWPHKSQQVWPSPAFSLKLATCSVHIGDDPPSLGASSQRGLPFWLPQDCNNGTGNSWQATASRALHRQPPETHPQSCCEKGQFTCPGPFA